jgi:hypothetical protein
MQAPYPCTQGVDGAHGETAGRRIDELAVRQRLGARHGIQQSIEVARETGPSAVTTISRLRESMNQ